MLFGKKVIKAKLRTFNIAIAFGIASSYASIHKAATRMITGLADGKNDAPFSVKVQISSAVMFAYTVLGSVVIFPLILSLSKLRKTF